MIRVKKLVFLLSLFWAYSASSQDYVDLFTISYDQIAERPFEDTVGNGSFDEVFMDLNLPIPIGKHAIVTGGQYESFRLGTYPDETLSYQSLLIKVGAQLQISEDITGTFILLPKYSGQNLSTETFQIGLYSLLNFRKTDHLKYKLGLYINDEFFGPLVVPIFGLYYQKDRFEANLNLPINADLNYQFTDNLKAGLGFQGIKKSYLMNRDYAGNQYLEKANNEVGLYLQYALGPINLQAMGGYSVIRAFRTYPTGDQTDWTLSAVAFGDDREQLNTDFPDGAFLKFTLKYRFQIPQ
jgi:hypothetical protein